MRRWIEIFAAGAIGAVIALSGTPSFARSAKDCRADYQANKDAVKASGQTEKAYIAACRAGPDSATPGAAATPTAAPAAPPAAAATSPSVKTAKECNEEYSTNRAAIKSGGQTKKAFIADCRGGTEKIPEAPAAAAPAPTVAPAPAPVPSAAAPAPTAAAPAAAKPKIKAGAAVAGGFATDTEAKATCPSDTVVWVNTKTKIYHFAGTHNYGTTKSGTYMCELVAKGADYRAAENEKHP